MTSDQVNLKRTPLFEIHKKLGAKLVSFAGWEMPVLYSGVIPEHNATRSAAGIFDVSHMGEIRVRGKEALKALNYLSSNNVSKIADGQAQYGAVLNEKGGIVDDIIVYRINAEEFFICVNASNADHVFDFLREHNRFDAQFENESAQWGQIAIQGPKAISIASKVLGADIANLKYFRFAQCTCFDSSLIVARTGYTGEDGVEIFLPAAKTPQLWENLLEAGQSEGLLPCGLGARDTLRLEACLPLHGHELSEEWTALESGLERFIALEKPEFIGKAALEKQKAEGLPSILAGFFLLEAGIARQGDKIFSDQQSQEIGFVTSGTKTPSVNKALGLALIPPRLSSIGHKFFVEIRGKKLEAEVVSTPFYKRKP